MNPDPEPQLTRVRALAGELHAHGLHSIQDASPCLTLTSRPTRQAAPEHAARTAPDHGSTAHGPAPDLVLRMSALDLRPLPGAVPSARLHARFVACEWGLAAIAGDCELIVAELVTNAVTHGTRAPGTADPPPVRLRLTGRAREVRIEVWDAGEEMPQMRPGPPGEDETGGRGLVLVAALSSQWGAYRTSGGGKCVFAVCGA
jgi:anti-sigma regulatory factor (Ser/Thr protein kinase)